MARVFISHASEDLGVARRVTDWLCQAGHDVFLSYDLERGIVVGDAWVQRLFDELYAADALVALVTTGFTRSPWCAAEVGIALAHGLRILPVRTTLCPSGRRASWRRMLPVQAEPAVAYRLISTDTQWTILDSDGTTARNALIEALRRLDGTGETTSTPSVVYPGLAAFTTGQARVFFGRSADSRALADRLRVPTGRHGSGLLAVVGPSGCGKSSLVRAGLVPILAADPDWLVLAPLIPAADPVAELVRLLAVAGRARGLDWTASTVIDTVDRPGGLTRLVADLLAAAGARRLLLTIDQAEELLTHSPPAQQRRFAGLLLEATGGPVRALATIRSEFLDPLATLAADTHLPVASFLVAPLARDMLGLVITGPARRAGISVDEELVARMVTDTGSGQALPLLAFVLGRLAETVSRGGRLSAAEYDRLGGVQGALAGQANTALAEAAAASGREPAAVLDGLLRLVIVDRHGQVARRRVALADLPAVLRTEMEVFVARRLLTITDDTGPIPGDGTGRRPVMDIAHEQLLTAWPPLAGAIAAADTLRLQTTTAEAAETWEQHGRPADYLWELNRAATAARTLTPDTLTSTTQAFLTASHRHGVRRRRRAIALLTAFVLLVTAGGATATVEWVTTRAQRQEALRQQRLATARGLLVQAEQLRGSDPAQALKLNLAAEHLASTFETRASLAAMLVATPWIASIDDDQHLTAVAFSPDGHTLTTISNSSGGGRLRVYDLTDPRAPARIASVDDDQYLTAVAFSSAGHTLTTISNSSGGGRLRVYDLTDPRAPARIASVDDDLSPTAVAFSPDGHTLTTTSGISGINGGGRLRVYDLTNPRAPARIASIDDDQYLTGVAFSPDGHTLTTATSISGGGRLRVYDLTNPRAPTRIASIDDDQHLTAVAFSPDSHTLTTATSNSSGGGRLRVYDLISPRAPTRIASIDDDQSPTAVAFSSDGHTLTSITSNSNGGGRLRVYDLISPRAPARIASVDDDQYLTGVAFSPDGHTLTTTTTSNSRGGGRLRVYDLTSPRAPVRIASVDDDQYLTAVAFSPDSHTLTTTSSISGINGGGRLRVYDLTDPRLSARIASVDDDQYLTAVAFSPDSHTLTTATSISGGGLRVYDLTDPRAPARIASIDDDQHPTAVAFSPDGHTLTTTSNSSGGGRLRVYDLTDPRAPTRIASVDDDQYLTAVAFSPDRHTLTTISNSGSGGGRLRVYDLANPRAPVRIASIDDDQHLTAVAFSPDGHTLTTTSNSDSSGGRLRVYDLASPRAPVRIASIDDDQHLTAVAFSPDGHTLTTTTTSISISSGGGGRLRVYDLTDPRAPTRIASVDDDQYLTGVTFSPDGRTLITISTISGSGGGRLRVYEIAGISTLSGHIHVWACDAAGAGLSAEEWNHFVPGDIAYRRTC